MRDEHNDRTLVERIDPLMGTVLDKRYRIDFRLASGGFGAIYRATDVETGTQYALKVLHAELASADARVIARFRREGATLAQLKNPHTIQAYELGEAPDGSLYIVMELLHGESLYEQFRAKGPLPWQRVAAIGKMVCASLGEAHALGVVHRDLKPANIHLENRDGNPDFVKVLDFGIAKINRESEHLDAMELTQAGQMIGTFDYMPPEQMVGGQCTGATDIYSLGVVLYEMVSGRRPFADAASPTAMLTALLTQSPPPLATPGVPREFERIVMRCLEREWQDRYQNVDELAADLERLIAHHTSDGVTRKMNATPPPELYTPDEATVIDHRRAKRGSAPHVVRRDEPAPTVEGRPRRQSEPPPPAAEQRAKRESSPPAANVIRRDGSGPVPLANRAEPINQRHKRPSEPPQRRDSQPIAQDPNAWQSLQMPRRDRESQPVPVVRHQDPESQPVPVARVQPDSQRVPRSYQAGAFVVTPDPAQQPTPAPAPLSPILHTPAPTPHTPAPIPHTPAPIPHTPTPLPAPMPPLAHDPNAAWRQSYPQIPPPRGSVLDAQTYDMAGAHSRDVVVRRVVWSIALVLGIVLAIVVASRL
jgi:serine/threonine-protein kinase